MASMKLSKVWPRLLRLGTDSSEAADHCCRRRCNRCACTGHRVRDGAQTRLAGDDITPAVAAARRQDDLGPAFTDVGARDQLLQLPPVQLVKEVWISLQVLDDLEPRHGDCLNELAFSYLVPSDDDGSRCQVKLTPRCCRLRPSIPASP